MQNEGNSIQFFKTPMRSRKHLEWNVKEKNAAEELNS